MGYAIWFKVGFLGYWGVRQAGHPVCGHVGPLRVAQDPCCGRPQRHFWTWPDFGSKPPAIAINSERGGGRWLGFCDRAAAQPLSQSFWFTLGFAAQLPGCGWRDKKATVGSGAAKASSQAAMRCTRRKSVGGEGSHTSRGLSVSPPEDHGEAGRRRGHSHRPAAPGPLARASCTLRPPCFVSALAGHRRGRSKAGHGSVGP